MTGGQMHEHKVHTDGDLVRRLLAGQIPQWAALPVTPMPPTETNNAITGSGTP